MQPTPRILTEAELKEALTTLVHAESDIAHIGQSTAAILASHQAQAEEIERLKVYGDVIAERSTQDERWGGPANDDRHTPESWRQCIHKHNERACYETGMDRRYALVRVAALAIAAIESFDRKANP